MKLPMPKNVTLDGLSQCCSILNDYRQADCPGFPKSNPFVDRLMEQGVTVEEAVDLLARVWDNS